MPEPALITATGHLEIVQTRWSKTLDRVVHHLVGWVDIVTPATDYDIERVATTIATTTPVVSVLSEDGRIVQTMSGTIYRIAGSGPIDWPENLKRTA